ncbi:MAG: aminotransferase class III-fold pyridoxal phosphate-dependent enzyme [Flavobacteriaceae bacterium]|nr:aminotransferase class III-fold pyridoxal phosphate-dependent enzyme [Flavobacteriaceae bacterium]
MSQGIELGHLSTVWSRLADFYPVKGRGTYLHDAKGNQYMDFTSGIGVTNTGHCHPQIVQSIQKQSKDLLFAQMNCMLSPLTKALAQKLNEHTPDSIDQFFFSNSGAEATEAAIKLAKFASQRPNIIVFQGSFHGRTHLTMAMTTSNTAYRRGYQPLPAGIFIAPFPYPGDFGMDEQSTIDYCIDQLQHLLESQTDPSEVAAIIIEPVLGEGGYKPVPMKFLRELRKICDDDDILFIIDEVQSGFGRTGKFFCHQYADIKPDILVMAKGMGSGLPISAIGASKELMSQWPPGAHGGTYGGGSLIPIAVAIKTIDVLIEENLIENAQLQGTFLRQRLQELGDVYPFVHDVRGLGLMVGVEFSNPEIAKKAQSFCLEQKLLLLTCGTHSNTIRWIPPLVVTHQQIIQSLKIFKTALQESIEPPKI